MLYVRSLVVLGLAGFAAAVALAPVDATAQQIYRFVSPDGRVTFSDTPPPGASRVTLAPVVALPSTAAGDVAALPFELRQAATRYPVVLYTGPECGPCASARTMLAARGIPFAEKTVSSIDDVEALKRLASVASLPLLTVGGQLLKGYSEIEWGQFLDAAGYPRTSQLPTGYQPPAATPLVAVQDVKPPPVRREPPAARAAAPAGPPSAPPAESGGIRF